MIQDSSNGKKEAEGGEGWQGSTVFQSQTEERGDFSCGKQRGAEETGAIRKVFLLSGASRCVAPVFQQSDLSFEEFVRHQPLTLAQNKVIRHKNTQLEPVAEGAFVAPLHPR